MRHREKLPAAASRAARDIVDRLLALADGLGQEAATLLEQWEEEAKKVQEARRAATDQLSALRAAYADASSKVTDPEAAFRLSREYAAAIAAVDADEKAAVAGGQEQQRRIDAERERVIEERKAMVALWNALSDAYLSEVGLAPWDGLALKTLWVLGASGSAERASALAGEGAVSEGGAGEGRVLQAREVVEMFKGRLGVSRSQFYYRFRPLLRSYPLSPTRLVRLPNGRLGLDGFRSVLRFRRDEVEALLAFLSRPTSP